MTGTTATESRALLLRAGFGTAGNQPAVDTTRGLGTLLKQVDQESDRIGQIDPRITIVIEKRDVSRITGEAVIAGQNSGYTDKEMPQESDRIRDVEPAILVRIPRPL